MAQTHEERLASQKRYRDNNRDKIKEYGIKYRKENQEYIKRYREENRERNKERSAKYYQDNIVEIKTKGKKWRDANKLRTKINTNKRRARRLNLPATLTVEEWEETLNLFENKCVYCGDDWEHMDHFIPSRHGGGYVKENIVPACGDCNKRKYTSLPEDFCGEERANEIKEMVAQ